MIPCPTCTRSHRDPEQVEKCAERAQRRAELQAQREADTARRLANQKALPEPEFIALCIREGRPWDRIVSGLNKDYPVREQGKWTLYDVVREDTKKLIPTWRMELDRATLMRLGKIFTGDYIGVRQPEGEGRNVLDEVPWTDEELKDAARKRAAEKKGRAA